MSVLGRPGAVRATVTIVLCAVLALACGCGGSPPGPDTPIFAGGEPVNHSLQVSYARAPLGPPEPPNPAAWSGFGGDAAHGFTRPGPDLRGHIAWFAALGGPVISSPAVAGGTVYVSGSDGFLRALDARSGRVRWQAGLGDTLDDSSPALGDGRVYANGYGTRTLAFAAGSGRLLWEVDNGHVPDAPPTFYRGLVLVPSDGNFLSCYDAATGRLYWRFQSEDVLQDFWPTTGAAAASGGTAYVALGASAEFMAIDLASGLKSWEYAVGERPAGAPTVAGGAVYVGTASGRILCLDASRGTLRWQVALPGGVGRGTRAAPLVSNGLVVIGGDDGRVYALAAGSGHRIWTASTARPVLATPLQIGRTLYLPGGDGKLYALDAATGRARWTIDLGELRASAAYAGGTLYLGGVAAAGLYAIR